MEVVAASAADAPALSDVYVTTWMATYRTLVPERLYMQWVVTKRDRDWGDLVRRQAAVGGGVLLARSGERVLGLCQYGPTEDDDDDAEAVGQVHRLFIHPDRQRQGVGSGLLADAVARLRQRGNSAATLWVLENDERARAFYERLGWRCDGSRRLDPSCDKVVDIRYRLAIS